MIGVVLPVMFIALYLVPFSSAFGGPDAFNGFMTVLGVIPLYSFFEVVLFALLILHAALMLSAVYASSVNVVSYDHYENWMYALRRLAGVIVIPFMFYFIFVTRMRFAFSDKDIDYLLMQNMLSSSWLRGFFAVGIVSVMFYLMSSFLTVLIEWGITVSRRSRNAVSMAGWCVLIALSAWGLKILFTF